MKSRKLALILFLSALSLPLLQTLIWLIGTSVNSDLYHQFDQPLFHEEGPDFALMIGGSLQCGTGALLGVLGAAFCIFRPPIRHILHLAQGTIGAMFFGWFLTTNWNFYSNNSSSEGFVPSPFIFDFMMCVFLGLPLLWCLGLIFVVSAVRSTAQAN